MIFKLDNKAPICYAGRNIEFYSIFARSNREKSILKEDKEMRLFEMKNIPVQAGTAKLHFGYEDRNRRLPFRDGETVYLPNYPDLEFFPLREGRQFLINCLPNGMGNEYQYWFGGTDENPFLVRLKDEAFEAFRRNGEKAFYEALKPEVISEFEQEFRVSSTRQGDIFAVPVPFTWDEFRRASLLCLGEERFPTKHEAQPVLQTRHKITGLLINEAKIFGRYFTLCEGILEAPDHSPLKLDRLHFLIQAQHLHQPNTAD